MKCSINGLVITALSSTPLAGIGIARSYRRRHDPVQPTGGDQRIAQKAGDGHRPDTTGHRGDRAGKLFRTRQSPRHRQGGCLLGSLSGLRSGRSSGTRLMPTSMTAAPGLIQSPRIISARPTAPTRMSARRQISWQIPGARMGDRHRAMAFASNSAAIGLPTMLERPTITALLAGQIAESASSAS